MAEPDVAGGEHRDNKTGNDMDPRCGRHDREAENPWGSGGQNAEHQVD